MTISHAPFVSFAAGFATGLLYYLGLWQTTKALLTAERPVLLGIGSFFIRSAAALLVFYLMVRTGLDRLGICMLGFFSARFIVTRRFRPRPGQMKSPPETGRADQWT